MPTNQSASALTDYANFISYAAGQGQTAGTAPGDLPPGYLPLPASLQTQAQSVVTQLQTLASATASPTASPTDLGDRDDLGERRRRPRRGRPADDDRRGHDDRRREHHRRHDDRGREHDRRRHDDRRREHGDRDCTGRDLDRTPAASASASATAAPSASASRSASASPSRTVAGTAAPASTACAATPQAFDVLPPSAQAAAGTTPSTAVGSVRGVLIIVLIIGAAGALAGGLLRYGRVPGRGRVPCRADALMTRDRRRDQSAASSAAESRPQRLGRRIVGSPAKEHPALPVPHCGLHLGVAFRLRPKARRGENLYAFQTPHDAAEAQIPQPARAGSVLAAVSGIAFAQTAPAMADPEPTLVAVGSDTIQDVWNEFTNGTPAARAATAAVPAALASGLVASYNATNPATGAIHENITPHRRLGRAERHRSQPERHLPAGRRQLQLRPPERLRRGRRERCGSRSTRPAATPSKAVAPVAGLGCVDIARSSSTVDTDRQQHRPWTSSTSRSRSTR